MTQNGTRNTMAMRALTLGAAAMMALCSFPAFSQQLYYQRSYGNQSVEEEPAPPAHGRGAYEGYTLEEHDEGDEKPLPPGYVRITSGTGFFVSNRGYIVTNEHVVHGCTKMMVRGAVNPMAAEVVGLDEDNDLALLKVDTSPQRVATLSYSEMDLEVGSPVMLMGYPENSGMTGNYQIAEASVLGLKGPKDEPRWIQFSDAARQGNSGGPLLDASGNVVGVIVGKARMVRLNQNGGEGETVSKSDIAISLGMLKNFLHANRVSFRANNSGAFFSTSRIENQARDYIVNIHCYKPTDEMAGR